MCPFSEVSLLQYLVSSEKSSLTHFGGDPGIFCMLVGSLSETRAKIIQEYVILFQIPEVRSLLKKGVELLTCLRSAYRDLNSVPLSDDVQWNNSKMKAEISQVCMYVRL